MSSPSLVRTADTTSLPNYTLSQFDMEQFAQAEEEFANMHRASVARFIIGQPLGIAERFIDAAERLIAENHFRFGGYAFKAKATSVSSLPALLWICLREKHPEVTREKARELYANHPDRPALSTAILKLMGYETEKNAGTGTSQAGASQTPAGGPSPDPTQASALPSSSEGAASATAKSPT